MDWDNVIQQVAERNRCSLPKYLYKVVHMPLYIYGAGSFGRELYQVFHNHGITVQGFLDRNAEECASATVPIYYPQDIVGDDDATVVLGIVMNKASRLELQETLSAYGFQRIVDGQSIRAHYVYGLEAEEESNPSKYFLKHLEEIRKAETLFTLDLESHETYHKNLTAHILRNYSSCAQTDQKRQYFVEDVPFAKGFSRFVDCGSYIGDTLQELCDVEAHVEAIAAFEPNLANFRKLSQCYDENLQKKVGTAFLCPCGVSGNTEQRSFRWDGGSSAIDSDGENVIQCVALDDVLKDFSPTFIKMDIEGTEYEALLGSKEMIGKYRPDLAISVYHIIDDFWRIPLLIHSWNLGYHFYLRTHSSCCMETILYAVSSQKGEMDV